MRRCACPTGRYDVTVTGGPEYLSRTSTTAATVRPGNRSELAVRLRRWIDPARRGWYSGDHHVHAAGMHALPEPDARACTPEDMIRQIRGEGFNIGSRC